MVNLNIPIAEELHKRVKLAALMDDKTLKEYIIESLEAIAGERTATTTTSDNSEVRL